VTVQAECGTIEYMSPDMLLKDEKTEGRVNNKLDVWSLGIILYYMTYGYFPLKHLGSFVQKMYAICDPSKKEFSFPPIFY
jgi:serine/threonine protein kinase